jgi:hypothetical protein
VAKRYSSLSDRVYALLLRLFPSEFRGDFAEQMEADFRDQCVGRAAPAPVSLPIEWVISFPPSNFLTYTQ